MENFSIHNLICLLFRKVAHSVEVKDNIYETVCADGVNYYERVDHIKFVKPTTTPVTSTMMSIGTTLMIQATTNAVSLP